MYHTCTCDNYFCELCSEGVGCGSHQTEVLSREDKEKLWETGVLSSDTPNVLLNAVFLQRKNFLLQGGTEHRNLSFSQLSRSVDNNGEVLYTYTENCSKNRSAE